MKGETEVSPDMPVTSELVSRLIAHKRFIGVRGDLTRMGVDQTELDRLLSLEEPVTTAG